MESTFVKKFANDPKLANEFQVGGDHYKLDYEHWDFVRDLRLDYFMGCITKYMCRDKGIPQEQCEKACHFIRKRTEIIKAMPPKDWSTMRGTHDMCGWWWPDQYEGRGNSERIYRFCDQLDTRQSVVIHQILQWDFKRGDQREISLAITNVWLSK